MKGKIILAFALLFVSLADVLDWILFSTKGQNENLDWTSFKAKYIEHLPPFLRPLYEKPVIITGILIACFALAGLLFVREKKKAFIVLGIFSFLLGFWQLFSLM